MSYRWQLERRNSVLRPACAHKTVLHLGDPKSAAWAEDYFGKIRRTERTFSENFGGKDGPTGSIQYKLEDRPALLASYFMSLPFTGPGCPFKAVNDVPWLDATIITERWFDELNAWRPPRSETVQPFEPREDKEAETIKDWTATEEKFFGVKPLKQRKKARRRVAKTKPERTLPSPLSSPELPGLEAPDPNP